MTFQTSAPIEHQSLTLTNRTARNMATLVTEGHIDLNPPYQRGDVWSTEQQMALVNSWLHGWSVPAIIVNDRMTRAWDQHNEPWRVGQPYWAVIDGKQRLTAAVAFFTGQLAVPATWFNADWVAWTHDTADGPYTRFTALTDAAQNVLHLRAPMPVSTAQVATVKEEAAMYLQVNCGGVAQTAADIAQAAAIARAQTAPVIPPVEES